MRGLLAITLLALLGLVVVCGRYWYCQRYDFVSPTKIYKNTREAIDDGTVARGWLPYFLPECATNISEKHNAEQNTVLATFHFEGTNCVDEMIKTAEELPAGILRTVNPRAIGSREGWFPDAILEGNSDKLLSLGFKIYRIARATRIGDTAAWEVWYIAVNRKSGVCALWYSIQRSLELKTRSPG